MPGRTFEELRKRISPKDFNRLCKSIAEEYAKTDASKATTYFTEKYNITKSCYSKMKDYAVEHYLVSDSTVDKMEKKARMNQTSHSCGYGYSTSKHYYDLRKRRKAYVYNLAIEYATARENSVDELLEVHGRDYEGYFYMLNEASIGEYGLTMEEVKQIQIRRLLDCTSQSECSRVCEYFKEVWQKRSSETPTL